MIQEILFASDDHKELDIYFERNKIRSFLLVCGGSLRHLELNKYFKSLEKRTGIKINKFSRFHPNPSYHSIVEGVKIFRKSKADSIVAVGGGSAMDVAKCIKLYGTLENDGADGAYLTQSVVHNNIKFLAIPTTAGSGSEATRYAVIYFNGRKQSITDESIIPSAVLFDKDVLTSLPDYQKKSTMLDALCHAVESFWSINSTNESKRYSKEAIRLLLANESEYISGNENTYNAMLKAAHMAGKAINITQTTAGHAMCYKLTSLYGIAHGHAAALCVKALWSWMIINNDKCVDPRGNNYLNSVFRELAVVMGCKSSGNAVEKFEELMDKFDMSAPKAAVDDIHILSELVNPTRLKNNPVKLNRPDIEEIYRKIFL